MTSASTDFQNSVNPWSSWKGVRKSNEPSTRARKPSIVTPTNTLTRIRRIVMNLGAGFLEMLNQEVSAYVLRETRKSKSGASVVDDIWESKQCPSRVQSVGSGRPRDVEIDFGRIDVLSWTRLPVVAQILNQPPELKAAGSNPAGRTNRSVTRESDSRRTSN